MPASTTKRAQLGGNSNDQTVNQAQQSGGGGLTQVIQRGEIPTNTGGTGGGSGTGGGGGTLTHPPVTNASGGSGQFGTSYGGRPGYSGGTQNMDVAGQSFSDTTRLQGALPFWQSPGVQVAGQQGYNPGQQFAGQRVTGESISGNPLISAAMEDFNMNVLPGINNQFNSMGLGRSSAAGNAMARAQASMMTPLYQQMAGLEDSAIQRQTQQGQFQAQQGQQEIDRLYGATTDEMNRRERSSNAQTEGQQWLAQFMQSQDQMQNAQTSQGAGQLFDMGGQARDYAQQGNQAQYQDFLRQMGLSEEALNPFGGYQGLMGTVTNGK